VSSVRPMTRPTVSCSSNRMGPITECAGRADRRAQRPGAVSRIRRSSTFRGPRSIVLHTLAGITRSFISQRRCSRRQEIGEVSTRDPAGALIVRRTRRRPRPRDGGRTHSPGACSRTKRVAAGPTRLASAESSALRRDCARFVPIAFDRSSTAEQSQEHGEE
jgi:hypothetical protein